MPETDNCISKEPPPKPTRIRTSSKSTPPGTVNSLMLNDNTSLTGTPIHSRPNLRPIVPLDANNVANQSQGSTNNEVLTTALNSLRKTDFSRERDATDINNSTPRTSDAPSRAPLPPPKPKRISLAPQPKAKPLSLQSVPLQPKVDNSIRSKTSPAVIAPTASKTSLSLSAPISSERTSDTSQSHELPRLKSVSTPVVSSPPPPVKKPRSTEHSMDEQTVLMEQSTQNTRLQLQIRSTTPLDSAHDPTLSASSSASRPNPSLIDARSRLRSTSDAKAPISCSVAFPQTTKTMSPPISSNEEGFGFGSGDMRSRSGISQSPGQTSWHNGVYGETSDEVQESTAAAATLAASLHKIQALAHEQTERMKQINYSEKRADLAEVVLEKSSMWKARGVEWGGIAKKAWDDRGGMGGIAGGLADRWKRRADGINEEQQDCSWPGTAEQIFGIPLEDAVRLSKISAKTGVPAVISRCIEYLDIMGVEEVGLYRVPGSTSNVARLKMMFDHGNDYDFLQKGNAPQNPHDVATLLKLYFRELPSPVIPADSMSSFNGIDFSDIKSQHQQKLKEALNTLPLENYILLGTLCQHLSNLAEYESCTKMNISNLGLIFCPTLQIGSVLFKNLLGGDGGDEERRKGLLLVWSDLDSKHEEMENLEMIKDFELSLELAKEEEERFNRERPSTGQQQQRIPNSSYNGYRRGQQNQEELDTSPTSLYSGVGLIPPSNRVVDSPDDTVGLNSYISPITSTKKPKPAETFDLYDELMTKEINEATSTPLIDFSIDDEVELRWRRHAREPAINRRTESQPASDRTVRHERAPAVSVRY
ncbi:hypothetical protein FBU30_003918 [Linnemannia zychae]|nr:hypothetical protein FBU30_003918 [Linnemannia zychae]